MATTSSPRPQGRFGPEVRARICALTAEGLGLACICALDDMPGLATVDRWLKAEAGFREAFRIALAAGGAPGRTARPTAYREVLGQTLCRQVGEGSALHAICGKSGMPVLETVHGWQTQHPEFVVRLAAAREILAQRLFDEVRVIADQATPTDLQLARTRIAVREWQAAKLASRKAGEAGDPPAPTTIVEIVRFADINDDGDAGASAE